MSEWISVDDKKPDSKKCVDVNVRIIGGDHNGDEGRIPDVFYDSAKDFWWQWKTCEETGDLDICTLDGVYVTHWMPLPEPPHNP